MAEEAEVPEHRCGFELTPENVGVNSEESLTKWRYRHEAISCCREPWEGSERCIWHADIVAKSGHELKRARADGPERLDGVFLRGLASGDGLSFHNCNLIFSDLTDADLRDAEFVDTNLRNTDFQDADLKRADFTNARLDNADLSGADLHQANLTNSCCQNVKFIDATVRQADCTGIQLREANFHDANLFQAKLIESQCFGAEFGKANLSLANFTDSILRHADFTDAELHGALLTRADCRGAEFTNARIYETVFADAQINSGSEFYDEELTSYLIIPRPVCVYEKNVLNVGLPEDTHPFQAAEGVYRRLEQLHNENSLSVEARKFHISKEEARRRYHDEQAEQASESSERKRSKRSYRVSSLNWYLTGHGESLGRILAVSTLVIGVSALLYPLGGFSSSESDMAYQYSLSTWLQAEGLSEAGSALFQTLGTFLQGLYFSIITFTTIGYGDLYPSGWFSKVLVGFESLAGAVLIALFIFVLGRRVAR